MAKATKSAGSGKAKSKKDAPKGLHLFGTDQKIYTVKDKSALTEVTGGENVIHGRGVKDSSLARSVPGPKEGDGGDVQGRHYDPYYGWHDFIMWGWIYDEYGDLVYARHYHPYRTEFAIYFS